jgi:hypothetical protein
MPGAPEPALSKAEEGHAFETWDRKNPNHALPAVRGLKLPFDNPSVHFFAILLATESVAPLGRAGTKTTTVERRPPESASICPELEQQELGPREPERQAGSSKTHECK